jgi:hypothetical protein
MQRRRKSGASSSEAEDQARNRRTVLMGFGDRRGWAAGLLALAAVPVAVLQARCDRRGDRQ